jgi:ArsR family transcriptional regulator, arsenate/arsenite/antimonite-responsive transcriptional repressor
MRAALRVFRALSDGHRLRMVFALRHGELCVCQLIELAGLSPSTVSKHLSILRDAGLLDSRKEGRWVYYRVADQPMFPIIGKEAPRFFQSLEKSPTVKADDARLRRILKMDLEKLCRKIVKG